jgi:hypothetical protein
VRRRRFVYYESIKRELNIRLIYECRCDERLKAKAEGSTRLASTGEEVVANEIDCLLIHGNRKNKKKGQKKIRSSADVALGTGRKSG